jgi:hypothetical protein
MHRQGTTEQWVRSQAFMQSLSFQLARLCFDQAAARSKGVTIISPIAQAAVAACDKE